ncbi:MAG: DUF222 domain-containing protein [Micropruina sp.]|nr:DUF222 domain-containing protein [Micropruina sp.]
MEGSRQLIGIGGVLTAIEAALARMDPDRQGLADEERLSVVNRARVLAGRMDSLLCALVAEADRAESSLKAKGTPTTSWLSLTGNLAMRESSALLFRAKELNEHADVREAALSGRIGVSQGRAICRVLDELPPELTGTQRALGERLLVDRADHANARQLLAMGEDVLAEIDPATATDSPELRLERQTRLAHQRRSLSFVRDQRGSVRFRGSLPVLAAEPWISLLDGYAAGERRKPLEDRDPLAPIATAEQRRADSLMAMIADHTGGGLGGYKASDAVRVMVVMSQDVLKGEAEPRGYLPDGEPISTGELRRLSCDAELIPAVLGTPSEVLDLGRSRRLVSPGLRAALILRDGGCVFPQCEAPASACQAHHLVPWWAGGATSLANLALLCAHHHSLVEPDKYGSRDQWLILVGADGVPEAIPPHRLDPEQAPIRHQRFGVLERTRVMTSERRCPNGDPPTAGPMNHPSGSLADDWPPDPAPPQARPA